MALSAAVNLQFRNTGAQKRYSMVVTTDVQVYKGGLIGRVTTTGKARPCRNATTETFAGIALSDKLGVADGSVSVTLVNDVEVLMTTTAACTIGIVNLIKLYAVDDASVGILSTLGPEVGISTEYVSASTSWILLRQQALVAAS